MSITSTFRCLEYGFYWLLNPALPACFVVSLDRRESVCVCEARRWNGLLE